MLIAGEELRRLILEAAEPLVVPCAAEQIQPNGVDLTLAEVGLWRHAGALGTTDAARVIPPAEVLRFDGEGWITLGRGGYLVTFAETVNVPLDMWALARPRSSLLRMGATVATALWDSGYRGRSRAMLLVANEAGVRLARGARLIQISFFRLPRPVEGGYAGRYQGEK